MLISWWTMTVGLAAEPSAGASEAMLAYGVCVACHGAHGEGRPAMGAPRIGDLDAAYLQRQLEAFRGGTRGQHPDDDAARPMVGVAGGLPEERVELLATFAASLDPVPLPPGPAPEDEEPPESWATCVTCHGDDARGNPELDAPALLHQDSAYLTRQLRAFREGWRGGEDAPATSQQMAAMAAPLSDDDIAGLVAHIASLRPEPPPLEHPEVTLEAEAGLAAFEDIYAVATHPRCMNCHPDGDVPLQTDASIPHVMEITRFSPLSGQHCSTCHAQQPVGDGLAPLPPADPVWSMPPRSMAFEGRTPGELCAQLQDPEANGRRGLSALVAHIAEDHLLQTSWHSGRTPPPISHPELVERFETWAAAGAPCPDDKTESP